MRDHHRQLSRGLAHEGPDSVGTSTDHAAVVGGAYSVRPVRLPSSGSGARRGDVRAAVRRVAALRGIPRLALRGEAVRLADDILRKGALPAKARVDPLHVGIAATHGIDFLLTWNLRHLANAAVRGKIEQAVRDAGLVPPIICTPEELMEPKP